MAASARSDYEILTEHFGYPPVSLLDDINNVVNIITDRAINNIEQGLLKVPPSALGFRPPAYSNTPAAETGGNDDNGGVPNAEDARRREVEAGMHQLETLLYASVDRNFDRFEIYVMRNIMCVRPDDRNWIRLTHYEGLDFSNIINSNKPENNNPSSSSSSSNPTIDSVDRLRRRLQASQKLNCMLHAEKARNAALLGEVRRLVGGGGSTGLPTNPQESTTDGEPTPAAPFAFLNNKGSLADGGAETPLTTTTAFTLSQLQALRSLSASLRNLMPDLDPGNSSSQDGGETTAKSWRRERLEYVETAARRHLERARGLELGADGEVRDGEWHGEGRSLAEGEVEGLERMVGILGGGGSNGEQEQQVQDENQMDQS
ncbi:Mis12 protein-domain-containing protein [Bombardia bombarda]|uniref:Mis12 protein-domain-containing protein n=1 Tax=Bombardia bombarda TaxID=252184 RepID=A0AA39WT85_9PEZI|nr:Mis12 protein-domain-containing protein [Bombardia bombarda]